MDNVVRRLRNVKRYADLVWVIPSVDPSPYLDAAVDRAFDKKQMCFIRGADMPSFPGRKVAEQLMQIRLTPYMEGVSRTLLRKQLLMRGAEEKRTGAEEKKEQGEEEEEEEEEEGQLVYFQDRWINTAAEPRGTGWIQYGHDWFRYRTSESSPTIW